MHSHEHTGILMDSFARGRCHRRAELFARKVPGSQAFQFAMMLWLESEKTGISLCVVAVCTHTAVAAKISCTQNNHLAMEQYEKLEKARLLRFHEK